MSWIDAGVSELRFAFFCHLRAREERNGQNDPSNNLLLFYAVECGLKAVLLRRRNLRTLREIKTDNAEGLGHDLAYYVKELRISAATVSLKGAYRLGGRQSGSCAVRDVHQAWRYGVRMDPGDEGQLVNGLVRLTDWVREELRR